MSSTTIFARTRLSTRWCKRLLLLFFLLIASPFLLLHLLVWIFYFIDRPLEQVETVFYKQPDGSPLGVFWRRANGPEITLIFVHGTPAKGSAFRYQMEHDFPRVDLITYDRPGFGLSPGSAAKANLDYQASTLLAVIAHMRTRKAILVGHSYGGPLVLKIAAMLPDQIAGVALIGGSVSPLEEHPLGIQYFGAWPLVSALLPEPVRCCNYELLNLKADLIALDRQLPLVRCPVLMLQGNKDDQVPDRNVPYLLGRFDSMGKGSLLNSRLFPTYNHFMMWEHPSETNHELEIFVQKCTPSTIPGWPRASLPDN